MTVVDNTTHPSYHIIYTNGKPDASVILDRWPEGRDPDTGPDIAGDEPNQFLVGIVPLMARPNATHAALIGFGSGVTCHTMLGSPNLERLDTVEIEPEMVAGSRFFRPVNWRAYDDPRSHIYFDDAKAYFASAGHKFDLIVSEPTNPWVSVVSSLFTVEFYQETKRYLKPGGLLAQWIQGYELSDELLMTVLAAIDQEFDDYLIVRIGSRDWVIVSSPEGPVGSLSPEALSWPGLTESFDLLGVHDVGQIDALVVANKRLLHPFISQREPNRDVLPLLDTGAEKARFMREGAEFLHELRWTPGPIMPVLAGFSARAYPKEGIGDQRDTHILQEAEQAAYLVRISGQSPIPAHAALSGSAMQAWQTETERLDLADAKWEGWLAATYAVYEVMAPYQPVHRTAWWTAVTEIVTEREAPDAIVDSIELLDALSEQDGERLWPAVELALADQEHPLPKTLRVADLGQGKPNDEGVHDFSSAAYALQVLRAYAER